MARSLVHGTVFLLIATLITRVLGVVFQIALRHMTDDAVIGMYTDAVYIYNIVHIIATAGIPVTISKFIAEQLERKDLYSVNRTFRAAMSILFLTAGFAAILFWFGAPYLPALNGLDDSVHILSLTILLVPPLSVLRGYFQAHQRMEPTAVSQIVEQIVRIIFMIVVVNQLKQMGSSREILSAGSMSGALGGAFVAFLLLVVWYRKERQPITYTPISVRSVPSYLYRSRSRERAPLMTIAYKLIKHTWPITLVAVAQPLLQTIDTFSFEYLLPETGIPKTEFHIKTQAGIYRRGDPYVNAMNILATALAINLIPTLARHSAKNRQNLIRRTIEQTWSTITMSSLPMATMIALLAPHLVTIIAKDPRGSFFLAILVTAGIFGNVSLVSSSILQGLGYNRIPIRHLLFAIALKLSGNFALIPYLGGVEGAAWATLIAYAIQCGLNVGYIIREKKLSPNLRNIIVKPILCTTVMSLILFVPLLFLENSLPFPHKKMYDCIIVLSIGCLGLFIYMGMIFRLKMITKENILSFPLGKKIISKWDKLWG
ncbi:putative polysaccharide biosynthesis protein [Pasteuria penetrans]|uniref:putative polysaccharide biosynthesis protein n=1 Tax=Pasteuria penetrans TaxID=86005 RepID=UPI000FBAE1A2|nr:polysaccharide biosynthesis protein [Pasteuria penetrans]